jgi:carbamate kinase
MILAGWDVVITHGNGPQMGFILRRSELALHEVAPVPMDYAGADLQGAIGYMFIKAFRNEFRQRGLDRRPVAVVTQTLVDRNDPAFTDPSKPIGSHMDEATAKRLAQQQGWVVKEDAGRGWRRVVPSPDPKAIIEVDVIGFLARAGYVVIACGGGGIPVIEGADGRLTGAEAVIDKDLASSLLATEMGADLLMVSTGVEKVAINFNKPNQRWLDRMTVSEARRYYAEDQFDRGSMGPKIRALVAFLEAGGKQGIITNPSNIGRALAGECGTYVVPG